MRRNQKPVREMTKANIERKENANAGIGIRGGPGELLEKPSVDTRLPEPANVGCQGSKNRAGKDRDVAGS